jgi:hypothetical protein
VENLETIERRNRFGPELVPPVRNDGKEKRQKRVNPRGRVAKKKSEAGAWKRWRGQRCPPFAEKRKEWGTRKSWIKV